MRLLSSLLLCDCSAHSQWNKIILIHMPFPFMLYAYLYYLRFHAIFMNTLFVPHSNVWHRETQFFPFGLRERKVIMLYHVNVKMSVCLWLEACRHNVLAAELENMKAKAAMHHSFCFFFILSVVFSWN